MSEKVTLGIMDYTIIAIMLAISAGMGLFFRVFRRQQKTDNEYLFAGRNMPILPVAFSLLATFMSTITLIGLPAEIYLYGTPMAFMNFGFVLGPIISSYVFLPLYFDNNVSTPYEYLERRFGKTTRRILSAIYLIQSLMFNGVILYAPALALSVVTNLSVWASVISTGVVCTFYCTLGGMKAVLWTDVFQAVLMYVCLIAIVAKGCLDLGGFGNIFKTAYNGGRMVLPTFDLDFSTRYTIYSVFLQGIIMTTAWYGCSQTQVQRQLTMKNVKSSTIASLISAPMSVAFQLLCCFCGLIFYVHYKECNPMTSPTKLIHSADQLMPLYITSTMRQYPGLAGLCIAGIFSASLSSLSSAVNAMTAVTYEDIIKLKWPKLSGSVLILKITSAFYGALSIFITYIVASMGNIIKATILLVGMVEGPLVGVFLLAAFTTKTTEMGANLGVVVSFLLACCMTFIPNTRYYPMLEVGKNCSELGENLFNLIFPNNPDESTNISSSSPAFAVSTTPAYPEDNFPVSFMWIKPITLLVCVVVGYFASWIISCFTGKPDKIPDILLCPLRRRFLSNELTNKNNELARKHEEICGF